MSFPDIFYYKYESGGASNQRFWQRLGGMPPRLHAPETIIRAATAERPWQ